MIVGDKEETRGMQRGIVLNGVPLEQLPRFKYLGSWITENARYEEDIRARVEMATASSWTKYGTNEKKYHAEHKDEDTQLLCVFSFNYGCENWTWNRAMHMKVNAFDFDVVLRKDIEDKIY